MIDTWELTIPEMTGDTPRRAYVYLPASYQNEPQRRYPVLYMFDGHNVFFDSHATYGKSWGMGEYLDRTGAPLIVAAVECNHDPDGGRLMEYSPYDFHDRVFGDIRGRGRETMEWMIGQFKPAIDAGYRTLPDRLHTFIGGSSMGGLMSLYALMAYNEVFSRAAALSPSLWVAPDALRRLIRTAPLRRNTVLYMDYGAREMGNHPRMAAGFAAACDALLDRRVLLTARIVPGGEHSEASWERQLPFCIPTLLYGCGD